MKFCYNTRFTLFKQPKDQDLSYKTDLDFLDCFGRKKLCLITEEIWYNIFQRETSFVTSCVPPLMMKPYLQKEVFFP